MKPYEHAGITNTEEPCLSPDLSPDTSNHLNTSKNVSDLALSTPTGAAIPSAIKAGELALSGSTNQFPNAPAEERLSATTEMETPQTTPDQTFSLFADAAICKQTEDLKPSRLLQKPTSLKPLLPAGIKPYYLDEKSGIAIICGDCREILPQLGRFDLCLTDPPYGHGDKWSGGTWAAAPMYDDAQAWDRYTPHPAVFRQILQASTESIIWGGNYLDGLPPSRCWLAWLKPSMPTLADFELAWTSMDRPAKSFYEARNPNGNGYRQHPTEKPLSLMAWCLQFTPEAKTVVDPFLGSGTTLRAAKDAGMAAVGIDINEAYCEIAAKRLAQEVLNFQEVASLEAER